MRFTTQRRRTWWAWMFALVLVLGIAGCGSTSEESAPYLAETEMSEEEVQSQNAKGGSPWVNSNEGGNLPIEQPLVTDDLYLHYNYDYLAKHAVSGGGTIEDAMGEMQESVIQIIKDDSKTSPDLEQLRIFYEQVADLDARAKTGLSEIQPYLDRIEAVSSIKELNELLASPDYPFTPFVHASLGMADMSTVNIVAITPNFVFSDGVMGGAECYQETDDPSEELYHQQLSGEYEALAQCNLAALGVSGEEAEQRCSELFDFEGSFGKYGDYESKWATADFGVFGQSNKTYTLDELKAMCPAMPLEELLAKSGMDGASKYAAVSIEWLGALNTLWTDDNLQNLKDLVTLSLMSECQTILDPELYEDYYLSTGELVPDADDCAYESCDNIETFGTVIGKIYKDDVLGKRTKERLEKMTSGLVEEYKELFQSTAWLDDESKANVLEKLDHMSLCILEPDGGYYDYSALQLTPTDEGGTLLGNLLALKKYHHDCEAALIDQKARAIFVWDLMSPTTVNCCYDQLTNSINIMPGFVTSAVYTDEMSDEELFATMGVVIGHEISHGFDFCGSQFDGYGRGRSIFTADDADTFIEKTQRLADYYSSIQISDGVYADGENLKVEAAADLSGLQASLACAKKIEGFDAKEYFHSFAKLWTRIFSRGSTLAISFDSHPLNYLRTNVNVQMFDDMYETYGVREGDNMYLAPEERIVMWGTDAT